jgi:hypothetical protein
MRILFSVIAAISGAALVATSSSALASSSPGSAASPYTYARDYIKGEVSLYTYTEDEAINGAEESNTTAVARLKSYVHGGIGGEQVKWVALSTNGEDLNAEALAFPPYDVSLDPRDLGSLALPDTQTAPDLQGPVDDLDTFYVGLSAHTGIGNLHQVGQSFVDPALLSGDFSNATTPVGQDLIQLTTTLSSLSDQQATFTSSYQPPPGGGLALTQAFMNTPLCGSVPNNFEQVQESGTVYQALWGCEQFTVTTVVSRATGQMISVQMTNLLQLDVTQCLDEALTECGPVAPLTLQRIVQYSMD